MHGINRIWKALAIVTITCFTFTVYVYRNYTQYAVADITSTKLQNVTSASVSQFRIVYFLETSEKGTLNLRQLASVESAARHIPNSKIDVLVFTDKNYTLNNYMAALEERYDVTFKHTLMKDFIEGTPLEPWYIKGDWKKSPYVVAHTSDALRYLTLWKYGGIYLDLDVIFTNVWAVNNNIVVAETSNVISNGIMAFTSKHPVLLNCLQWLGQNYMPDQWSANGPALVTKMVKEYLNDPLSKDTITILPNTSFYEIYYTEVNKFFDPQYSDEVLRRIKPRIGVHVWNQISAETSIVKNSSCAYNIILSRRSPTGVYV